MESIKAHWPTDQFQLQFLADQLRDSSTAMVLLVLGAGILFLFYGRILFRFIIMINTALLAGALGWQIGTEAGKSPLLFALGFGAVFGLLSWPLFKIVAALLCGLAGTTLIAQIAPILPRGDEFFALYSLAGFVVFSVVGGLLIPFAVTLITALEGSIMTLLSLLTLAQRFGLIHQNAPWIKLTKTGPVHIAVAVLAILGIFYQLGISSGNPASPKESGTKPASK
jgi:MFS family permease